MIQLGENVELGSSVYKGQFNRKALTTGIVHIGLGAFHRAHQALYTDETIDKTGDMSWGIVSANIFGGQDLVDGMKQQNGLYTVTEKRADGSEVTKLVQCALDQLWAEEDRKPLLELMVEPSTRIVSLTITEKGYLLNPADGSLMVDNPLIIHDLKNLDNPRSAMGLIVSALKSRREQGVQPFTVMSCDNMPHNGKRVETAVIQFAEAINKELAQWIRAEVCFPSTMVDRIVPAVMEADLEYVSKKLNIHDGCAIITEEFRQWVIEDKFSMGRPEWDQIEGVTFVENVAPYEDMKLRMLNGSHSILAYSGYLGNYTTVSEAMSDPDYYRMIAHYMLNEAAPTLSMPEGTDVQSYADLLLKRFLNPGLQHRTWQIAMDGSQKIPQRWLNGLVCLRKEQKANICTTLGLASWMRYVGGRDEQNNTIDVRDPMAQELYDIANRDSDAEKTVKNLLSVKAIFDLELVADEAFVGEVVHAYRALMDKGAKACVAALPVA
ncbi:mannitol dehydrogenase family protein [Endozoicomonas elysicola]|uniref:D-mannonate oxidoreductase n=1 Tax=Endozoicomonas elysicola TaxID=305900 RepID=A0A081KGY0_9GAMM|nr:mannitol dehydrogenase family protein [Endozoicomonas elysicola]KEI73406.1 hypothetical protein GV64_24160 [Endozoicomonas elysicola]